ncbi:TniQ family protein [Streptomyces lateritius]|uniref:TniQ family protein n=1 Tax=Streptomyces lateritius TaxID=67313 RepID=UPI001C8C8636|nr:TniQ family protein [Streptomyces lateritius]MBX9423849.1 TniQ family protein [Streptomyces lateritius]
MRGLTRQQTDSGARPFPLSLDPLPDESLPGYLLRLSHRLGTTPSQLAVMTGLLPTPGTGHMYFQIPARFLINLCDTDRAATFGLVTKLSTEEVLGLTLASLGARYGPLNLDVMRRDDLAYLAVHNPWVFTASTRCCPECLAGDGSTIQEEHGGSWQRLWRLAPVFACLRHRRMLIHECPECRQPIHSDLQRSLIPRIGDATLHPTQCRRTTGPISWRGVPPPVCGTHLSRISSAEETKPPEAYLNLQRRLLELLTSVTDPRPTSVGAPVATAEYFADLHLLSALILLSWPHTRELNPVRDGDEAIAHEADRRLAEVAQNAVARGRKGTTLYWNHPPADSTACAAVLGIAERLLAYDRSTAQQLIQQLLASSTKADPRSANVIRLNNRCSPSLRSLLVRGLTRDRI